MDLINITMEKAQQEYLLHVLDQRWAVLDKQRTLAPWDSEDAKEALEAQVKVEGIMERLRVFDYVDDPATEEPTPEAPFMDGPLILHQDGITFTWNGGLTVNVARATREGRVITFDAFTMAELPASPAEVAEACRRVYDDRMQSDPRYSVEKPTERFLKYGYDPSVE